MSALVIKAICRRIKDRYGSVKNVAKAAGVTQGVWSNYQSDDHPDVTIPFHRLLYVANAAEKAAFIALLQDEDESPAACLMEELGDVIEGAAATFAAGRAGVTPLHKRKVRDAAVKLMGEVEDVLNATEQVA